MTDDDLIEAIRASLSGRAAPAPATEEAALEAEAVIGFPIPPILRRLYLEVANGGFGPRFAVMGVRGHNYFTGADYADIVDFYGEGPGEDGEYGPPGMAWLLDWGCAQWSICDFRAPEGMMWGWDPEACCTRHRLFPKDQSIKDWLADSIGAPFQYPFYDGWRGFPSATDENGCRREIWVNGRRVDEPAR